MDMPRFTNSFKGGMNKDISPNEFPNTCYYDAVNFRVIVDDSTGLTTAALSSPKGNLASFTLPISNFYLGSAVLRDKIIILAKDTTIGATRPDKVYVLNISDIITGTNLTVTGAHLVYEQNLNFNVNYPIKVVANYENSEVQKIYFVDGLNSLRHLNIISDPNFNDLSTLDPELLNILPNHTYGSYTLEELTGGHLKAGRIQYSYQLYSVSGTETMFAPPSQLYNLTTSGLSDGIEFLGSDIETEVNKSIRVTVTLGASITSTFNRIRLVALEYETYGDVPTVRVVAELELGYSSVSFIDSGNSIAELTLEEFQVVRNEITPTTIETKNNYLFAANIKQEAFDVDDLVKELLDDDTAFLDTRAYRWRYMEAGVGTGSGAQALTEDTDPSALTNVPAYPNAAHAFDVAIIEAYNTSWHIHVLINPEVHAAAQVPVRTVTGISNINGLGCNIRLRTASTVTWDEQGFALDFDGAYIDGYDSGTHTLSIRGTKYFGTPPQDLTPPWSYGNYDVDAITQFSYTYTYTYTLAVGTTGFECTVNKVDILGNSPGTSPELVIDDGFGSGCGTAGVPEKHDCINTYNNISNDSNIDHQYKFKQGVANDPPLITDLGGTGDYISFDFITEPLSYIGSRRTIASPPHATNNYIIDPIALTDSYANPQIVMDFTSYQRNEVYRFALIVYDLKGRPSFAKWIADVRFPDISEYLHSGASSNAFEFTTADPLNPTEQMNGVALGIRFSINWSSINTNYPGLLDELSGFQIVRAPRTELDCTIKAQGLIVPTHHVTTPNAPTLKDTNYSTYNITSAGDYLADTPIQIAGITGTNVSLDQELVELLSPEIVINKNLDIDENNDFLEVVGHLSNVSASNIVVAATNQKSYTVVGMTVSAFTAAPSHVLTDYRRTIEDAIVSLPEAKQPTTRVIGTTPYTARGYDDDTHGNAPEMAYKGTSLVAEISSAFSSVSPAGYIAGDEQALYGRYRRSLGHSIYGGSSYSERSYTNYIDISGFRELPDPVALTTYSLYGGDTYIAPFNFLKLFYDYKAEYAATDGEHSGQVLVGFPTESRINLNYKLDNIPFYFTVPETIPDYYLAEQASIGVSQYPNGYPSINDLYRYNSAYSAENISKIFIPKPFDYRSVEYNDVMVTSSEKKYNGEYTDSWLKFKFNNYIELEGEYGAITRLINSNERLVAFQPRAIAVLSVLERELVETNNVASLAVGTGGILSRYDYLSRVAGTSLYYAIVNTDFGLYFYDDKNIAIYRISENLEPLSDTKGLKSYFESNPYTELILSYDKANREVLFTPSQTYLDPTICFSGYIDAFSSFYTFNSAGTYVSNYINFDKYLLSSLDGRIFYIHNLGNYNQFYGNYQTSSLTLITNPAKNNVVTFHTIDWLTDLTIVGIDDLVYTFDTLRITNTHQDTGTMTLITRDDLKRRFRKWRINTFRDLIDEGRIRDSWIKSHFTWTQDANNKKLVVHPIDYLFLPTKIR